MLARAEALYEAPYKHENGEAMPVNLEGVAAAIDRRRTCHERVACPRCHQAVGERCFRMRPDGSLWGRRGLQIAHKERWEADERVRLEH